MPSIRIPRSACKIVELENLQGYGIAGGPNADSPVVINGWVGPLDPRVGLDIHVVATRLSGEPPLFAAFPKPVHDAIGRLTSTTPEIHGNAIGDITMPIGIGTKPTVTTDIQFDDITAKLTGFPYPLHKLSGTVKIRDGYCDVINARMNPGDASWIVNGKVSLAGRCHSAQSARPGDQRADRRKSAQRSAGIAAAMGE